MGAPHRGEGGLDNLCKAGLRILWRGGEPEIEPAAAQMRAVMPLSLTARPTVGRHRSKSSDAPTQPLRQAHSSAVSPPLLRCSGSVSALSRTSITAVWPPAAAQKRGGLPLSRVALCGSAPCASSTRATPASPTRQAIASAVKPALSEGRSAVAPPAKMRSTCSAALGWPLCATLASSFAATAAFTSWAMARHICVDVPWTAKTALNE